MMTGVDIVQVPYRGQAPALTDLLAGQVQVLFNSPPASIEYIKAGRLRALAVTTATRSEMLPGIPTVGEFVPGYEASQWFGIGAPKNTPAEIVDKLNQEINAALADPNLKARLAESGGMVLAGSPADFGKFITEETDKWGKVSSGCHRAAGLVAWGKGANLSQPIRAPCGAVSTRRGRRRARSPASEQIVRDVGPTGCD
jgi:tripartite-type tricarboxylate transporter receptor subunit TctC